MIHFVLLPETEFESTARRSSEAGPSNFLPAVESIARSLGDADTLFLVTAKGQPLPDAEEAVLPASVRLIEAPALPAAFREIRSQLNPGEFGPLVSVATGLPGFSGQTIDGAIDRAIDALWNTVQQLSQRNPLTMVTLDRALRSSGAVGPGGLPRFSAIIAAGPEAVVFQANHDILGLAADAAEALVDGLPAWLKVLHDRGVLLLDLSVEFAASLVPSQASPGTTELLPKDECTATVRVAANHTELFVLGYRPVPMTGPPEARRRVLLGVPVDRLPVFEQLVDVVARVSERAGIDLVLLDESHQPGSDFHCALFARYPHLYWYGVASIAEAQREILQGSVPGLANCLFASHLRPVDLVNEEVQNVFIDWRQEGNWSTGFLEAELARLTDLASSHPNHPSVGRAREALCTLVTSVFRSDEYVEGFFRNTQAITQYPREIDHLCLVSRLSDKEREAYLAWFQRNENALLLWHARDPGLYPSWNIGIRLAETEYVSNANVDDLRHPDQVRVLVEDLRLHPEVAVAASSNIPFESYTDNFFALTEAPWFVDQAGIFGFTDLGILLEEDQGYTIKPNNLPHCMPVWRKQLHEVYGYFDEPRFGTFADWAFWLKVTKAGESGYLNPRPLSSYFINPGSHNRRGDRLLQLHREVEREFLADFYFRSREKAAPGRSLRALGETAADSQDLSQYRYPKKLSLTGLQDAYGQHRSAFNRLIASLLPLNKGEGGIKLIPFIERYFVWGTSDGEAASASPRPIEDPWIGIVHVPFDAPPWFESSISPEVIFESPLWQASLPHCRGLIGLTEDLRRDLQAHYPQLANLGVKHPTELTVKTFDIEAYLERPRVVQVGDWLRKLHAIHALQAPGHEKVMLLKEQTRSYWERETVRFGGEVDPSVQQLDYVSNQDYDELLSSSVVLSMLYATSANNVVIECIARSTPLIVNPLPAVVEYLGEDYPLYAETIRAANKLLSDPQRVRAAHQYLSAIDKADLSFENFLTTIAESAFYAGL